VTRSGSKIREQESRVKTGGKKIGNSGERGGERLFTGPLQDRGSRSVSTRL
jgi:hypothetical protein